MKKEYLILGAVALVAYGVFLLIHNNKQPVEDKTKVILY